MLQAPDLAIDAAEFDADIIRRCAHRGLAQVCPHVDTLTTELVDAAHAAGLTVRAYGILRRE